MDENYQIDGLDRKILQFLQEDARMSYLDIARKLIVSGGTIHQRIDKLRKAGIIEGSRLLINPRRLGLDVAALIGIHLQSTKDLPAVIEKMKKFEEITEAHYTTGTYALLIKVIVPTIEKYHQFLSTKLQSMEAIRATESFIIMDNPINRKIPIP